MSILKNQTVIDCLQLSDTKIRDNENLRHFWKAAFLFLGVGLLKTWQGENDG